MRQLQIQRSTRTTRPREENTATLDEVLAAIRKAKAKKEAKRDHR